jgi:hypothetical protein
MSPLQQMTHLSPLKIMSHFSAYNKLSKSAVRLIRLNLFQTLNAYNSETRGARSILTADLESLF